MQRSNNYEIQYFHSRIKETCNIFFIKYFLRYLLYIFPNISRDELFKTQYINFIHVKYQSFIQYPASTDNSFRRIWQRSKKKNLFARGSKIIYMERKWGLLLNFSIETSFPRTHQPQFSSHVFGNDITLILRISVKYNGKPNFSGDFSF